MIVERWKRLVLERPSLGCLPPPQRIPMEYEDGVKHLWCYPLWLVDDALDTKFANQPDNGLYEVRER